MNSDLFRNLENRDLGTYPTTEKGDDCHVKLFISRQGDANSHVRYDCAPRGVVRCW
jgi:hypothetical protein